MYESTKGETVSIVAEYSLWTRLQGLKEGQLVMPQTEWSWHIDLKQCFNSRFLGCCEVWTHPKNDLVTLLGSSISNHVSVAIVNASIGSSILVHISGDPVNASEDDLVTLIGNSISKHVYVAIVNTSRVIVSHCLKVALQVHVSIGLWTLPMMILSHWLDAAFQIMFL